MDQVMLQIIITLGGVIGGVFALMRYFLNHLEKKNGHLERIAKTFAETVDSMTEVQSRTSVEMAKMTASNERLSRAIETGIMRTQL